MVGKMDAMKRPMPHVPIQIEITEWAPRRFHLVVSM